MISIIQNEKQCYICGTQLNLECHHVFSGTANRRLSEKYGLKVWLCLKHHNTKNGAQQNNDMALVLKKIAQAEAMKLYSWSKEDFIKIFGRNYI